MAILHRANYGRLLIVLSIIVTILFPLLLSHTDGPTSVLRAIFGTYGISIATLWSPALTYAGFRKKCYADVWMGFAGMLTLLYWIPVVVYS